MKPTLLLDCNYLGWRAYHTTGDLSKDGILFGFLWTVLTLAEQHHTNRIACCWDSRRSLRREIYPEYKATRRGVSKGHDEERVQVFTEFNLMRSEYLPLLGFHQYCVDGYEADDIIAGIVRDNPAGNFVVVASDKDLLQLLAYRNVTVLSLAKKGGRWDTSRFLFEYGVKPSKWPLVKAICGCPTDNIKGVPGMGEKTAIAWLRNERVSTKKLEAMEQADALVKSNYALVKLPFHGLPRINLELLVNRTPMFVEEPFKAELAEHQFYSMLTEETWPRWKAFIGGYR